MGPREESLTGGGDITVYQYLTSVVNSIFHFKYPDKMYCCDTSMKDVVQGGYASRIPARQMDLAR